MAYPTYPYTDFHRLNGDYLLQEVNAAKTAAETAEAAAEAAEALAASAGSAALNAVQFVEQELTTAQKAQARSNIGAASDSDTVKVITQMLTANQKSTARANIGAADLEEFTVLDNTAVRYTAQAASTANKIQARQNIGAASTDDVEGVLKYTAQVLSDAQKSQARTNIGAVSSADIPVITGAVHYDEAQTLTDAQKLQARTNIAAAAESAIPDVSDVLRYSAQSLTAAQKSQARRNIGVSGSEDMPLIVSVYPNTGLTGYETDTAVRDIIDALDYGRAVVMEFTPINSSIIYCGLMAVDEGVSSAASCTVFLPTAASSAINTSWYYIYMAAGTPDTITVTSISGRLAPDTSISDNGKTLVVANGRPAWVQKDPVIVQDTQSSTITVTPAANTIYNYGELSSLTITSPPATGSWVIKFTSGSTPTTTTIPATVIFPEPFAAAANTRYEINVEDGYAVAVGWPVS